MAKKFNQFDSLPLPLTNTYYRAFAEASLEPGFLNIEDILLGFVLKSDLGRN